MSNTTDRVLLGVALLTTTAALVLWLTGNVALTRRGRIIALCERQWSTQRAMAIVAGLDAMATATAAQPDAAKLVCTVLLGSSEARSARAEPSLTRAAAFVVDRSALRASLMAQRAVAPSSDEKQLEWLWTTLVPSLPYKRRDKQWDRLGFQGNDPTTDFRSMAGVGLADLRHVVSAQRSLCARLVDDWSAGLSDPGAPPPTTLPLALTSINASAWLWSLLEHPCRLLDRCLLARGATLASYRELFVELFVGFCDEWTRRAPESVMAFEEVAAPYVARIREHLRRGGEQLLPPDSADGARLKHGKQA